MFCSGTDFGNSFVHEEVLDLIFIRRFCLSYSHGFSAREDSQVSLTNLLTLLIFTILLLDSIFLAFINCYSEELARSL